MRRYSFSILTLLGLLFLSSCEDMLEVETTRQVIEPELGQKTDSLSYALGILQAMQQLADVYVIQNEMRADLADYVPNKADTSIVSLADYKASKGSKYGSATPYYRIVNNCNYYLKHQNPQLTENGYSVVYQEYASIAALRAWAYLQIVRQFGTASYTEEPLTAISQIDNASSLPRLDLQSLTTELINGLVQYSGTDVPYYGGDMDMSGNKHVNSKWCFVPVDVILGDLYLERGNGVADYQAAAQCYYRYLYANKLRCQAYSTSFNYKKYMQLVQEGVNIPDAFSVPYSEDNGTWKNIFLSWRNYGVTVANQKDIVTYIPMASNYLNGVTSNLPLIFGFDLYSVDDTYVGDDIQVVPNDTYVTLSDTLDYYYFDNTDVTKNTISSFKGGDQRCFAIFDTYTSSVDETVEYDYFTKYQQAYITVYRVTTIYMHLAEAINRMGYPDAAFAVLKDGLSENLISEMVSNETQAAVKEAELVALQNLYPTPTPAQQTQMDNKQDSINALKAPVYLSAASRTMLTTVVPFCSDDAAVSDVFSGNTGIHNRGCGELSGTRYAAKGVHSPYQFSKVVADRIALIEKTFNVTKGTTPDDILAAQINAVEDLLCDEYALEFTFEGSRFSDLTRMARHKNQSSVYGANFGGLWFDKKMHDAHPGLPDLKQESSWYLPVQ